MKHRLTVSESIDCDVPICLHRYAYGVNTVSNKEQISTTNRDFSGVSLGTGLHTAVDGETSSSHNNE